MHARDMDDPVDLRAEETGKAGATIPTSGAVAKMQRREAPGDSKARRPPSRVQGRTYDKEGLVGQTCLTKAKATSGTAQSRARHLLLQAQVPQRITLSHIVKG